MSDEFDDDYDEFVERIKKFLNIDSDIFDVDFLFLPESNFDQNMNLKDEDLKGFKVTYHFESGMDKPEIRIEGNFDEQKLKDYFKRFDLSNISKFNRLGQPRKKQALDVGTISLEPFSDQEKSLTKEPYYELNIHEEFTEIVTEAPGIEKGHILLSLNEDGRKLKISMEINYINTVKEITLPFECVMEDHALDVNNGIVSIKLKKKNI